MIADLETMMSALNWLKAYRARIAEDEVPRPAQPGMPAQKNELPEGLGARRRPRTTSSGV